MRQAILVSVVAVAAAVALRAPAADAKTARLWNPATVGTVEGTVDGVERVEMGDWRCVRLKLRTADGILLVRVGPDWFLTEQKLVFAAGEKIQVKGSRLQFSGEPTMVAGEIVRGGEKIVLRDAGGKAAWSGK
jgi:hypothetical protein